MALYTSNYLKNLARDNSLILENRIFSERKKTHTSFDIFLSHSFLDKDEVKGLYQELTNLGFSVYVDWIIDPDLDRSKVTKQTAELIRSRMKMSKTLLLAVSANAALSKWMPWELGYVDGNTAKCAILPVSLDNITQTDYTRVEYLLLYPYVKRAQLNYTTSSYITESGNNYVSMKDWINKGESPSYKSTNIINL